MTPVTAQEVADRLRTTKPTVIRWAKEGKIPAVVAEGRVFRFDMEDVLAALAKPATRPLDLRAARD